jgi:hypothetical protein
MKKLIPAVLIAGMLSTPAMAEKFITYGAPSCGAVIADWEKGNERGQIVNESWELGFVSGAGYMGPPQRHYNHDGIALFVRQFCLSHPLDDSADAIIALLKMDEPNSK